MTFYPKPTASRCSIDGANLYSAAKALNFDIDYKKLLDEFRKRGVLIRAYYYTAIVEGDDYSPIRPLVDWLDYNGFSLVTKSAREYTDSQGRKRWRGDMDMEIAVDMMELSASADHLVLFSGDGDFRALVEAVQRKGVRVTVVSTVKSQPPMASDDLRRQADNFDRTRRPDPDRRPPASRRIAPGFPAERSSQRPSEGRLRRTHPRRNRSRRRRVSVPPEAPRDCPLCPRLVAYREENHAKEPTWFNGHAAPPSFGSIQERARAGGGSRARSHRRQPHGPPVHRRFRGRALVRNADQGRLRARRIQGPSRRRPRTHRLHDHQRRALRPARRTSRRRRKKTPAAPSCRRVLQPYQSSRRS